MEHLTETQLNEYLDQMLDKPSRLLVEAHLAKCDQCRAHLMSLESLFSTLADLPDIPLTHDLSPYVLARLQNTKQIPSLWKQPAFIAQTLLTIILLVSGIPTIRRLGQQIENWGNKYVLPTMQFPSIPEMFAQLPPLMVWKPQFAFNTSKFSFSIPTLPTFPFSLNANILLILVISAGLLWVVGNIFLLRRRPEVRE